MASAAAKIASASRLTPVIAPLSTGVAAYAGYKLIQVPWRDVLTRFFTGPGRTSRIALLLFLLTNRKNLLFAWTARVWGAMLRHIIWPRGPLPQEALFRYCVTESHTPILETDYNMHKSNSTYLTDLDVSRTHLCIHLFGKGMRAVSRGETTILDKEGKEVPGRFGIALGSLFCSWKREIPPYKTYEIWSRVLAWDRKWLVMVSYFVEKGKVPRRPDGQPAVEAGDKDWEKHIYATSVSRYVFKKGRFTIHPSILIEASGLLPSRPGDGWRGGESETGSPDDLSDVDDKSAKWDWRVVESKRRAGMVFADHFGALEGLHTCFDAASAGSLGKFLPG